MGVVSSVTSENNVKRSVKEMVRLMMPVYYLDVHELSSGETLQAADAWNLIMSDTSPEYLKRKANESPEEFPYESCMMFFYDSFYKRLFDIHPSSRPLFKNGMKAQGRFLVSMISLSLAEFRNPEKFDGVLKKLAEGHYERGVKSVECNFSLTDPPVYFFMLSVFDFL
jgi:hypothetical protein